jgi:excisionase family DNA binding protein
MLQKLTFLTKFNSNQNANPASYMPYKVGCVSCGIFLLLKGGKLIMRKTLTAKEAANLLGLSYWSLLEIAKRKEIPHIRAGKRVLFRLESLEHWMDQQEMNSIRKSEKIETNGTLRKVDI